jgi:hypothetical protein
MKPNYQMGRDGPLFCSLCTRKMPFHSEHGCLYKPICEIDGWSCRMDNGVRVARRTDDVNQVVSWTPDQLTIRAACTISIKVISWLLVLQGCDKTVLETYDAKWVE